METPFQGIVPFKYVETPLQGSAVLGVVGYPGDKTYKNQDGAERGAEMYEEFASCKWNLSKSSRHMLEYQMSTFAGGVLPPLSCQ